MDSNHKLWKFFQDEHGITLTEGQLQDIVSEVQEYINSVHECEAEEELSKSNCDAPFHCNWPVKDEPVKCAGCNRYLP